MNMFRERCPDPRAQMPQRRIPKQQTAPIEITRPGKFNNGNIDIIRPEPPTQQSDKKMTVEEHLINGRRYRIPERIILLDFWNKIGKNVDPPRSRYVFWIFFTIFLLNARDQTVWRIADTLASFFVKFSG
jgi:hypothetical protein